MHWEGALFGQRWGYGATESEADRILALYTDPEDPNYIEWNYKTVMILTSKFHHLN